MFKKPYHLLDASTSPNSLGNKFRQKRMLFFREVIEQLPKPLNVLDIGGNEEFWINAGFQNNNAIQITILNLTQVGVESSNMKSVSGDATDLSLIPNDHYDIAFSNSVIEHLYSKSNQVKMAKEAVRVGKHHFIQTPNKFFLIEPHYLLPFFQFLPKKLGYFILTKTKLSRLRYWDKDFARNYLEEIRLLSLRDMQEIFPASDIWHEKFIFMTKSFVAHDFKK